MHLQESLRLTSAILRVCERTLVLATSAPCWMSSINTADTQTHKQTSTTEGQNDWAQFPVLEGNSIKCSCHLDLVHCNITPPPLWLPMERDIEFRVPSKVPLLATADTSLPTYKHSQVFLNHLRGPLWGFLDLLRMCTYGRKANYFVKITQSYSSDPRPRPVSPVPLPSVCEEPVTVGPALGPALMTPTHTHTHTQKTIYHTC